MAAICAFIIPLRSKRVSSDWKLVSFLCRQTVNSCLNTQVKDIRVLIVGHEKPDRFEEVRDNRVEFIEATHQPPEASAFSKGMNDKWAKVAQGFVELHYDPPEYIMILDADDLVSSRLVNYIKKTKPMNGLIIKHGYIYDYERHKSKLVNHSFNCGSNSVIRTDVINLPSSLSEKDLQECIPLVAGHTIIEQRMRDEGKPLSVLPFPAVIYLQHAGQHSREGLRERGLSFPSYFKKLLMRILDQVYVVILRLRKRNALQNEFGFLCEEQ